MNDIEQIGRTHIVVIEDHPDILEVERLILESAGYRVTALPSIAALDELLKFQADCFILDEQLPLVSGHIICIYLRSKSETANVPVILVSAHPKLGDYAGLCDADSWINKPFDNDELLMQVSKAIAKKQAPRVSEK